LRLCDASRLVPGRETWLLQHVNLEVRAGQRVALVGPSGAGKSLLLRCLALLDPLDQGQLEFRGKCVSAAETPAYRRQVMYVPQRAVLIEGTVRENLALPFMLAGWQGRTPDWDWHVARLAEVGRDAGFLERGHRELSGGEGQLVQLLRICQLRPTVLLLDEPTASLDTHSTQVAERWLQAWFEEAQRERAWLWISHSPEQAQRVGPRTLEVAAGQVREALPSNEDEKTRLSS